LIGASKDGAKLIKTALEPNASYAFWESSSRINLKVLNLDNDNHTGMIVSAPLDDGNNHKNGNQAHTHSIVEAVAGVGERKPGFLPLKLGNLRHGLDVCQL